MDDELWAEDCAILESATETEELCLFILQGTLLCSQLLCNI